MAVKGTLLGLFIVFKPFLGTRMREGIRAFREECKAAGRSEKTAHLLYVNGLDQNETRLSTKVHLQRGASLSKLTDMWLHTWGEEETDD